MRVSKGIHQDGKKLADFAPPIKLVEISGFKLQLRNVFDPLALRLGLSGPIESSITTTTFILGYYGDKVGLEIDVDMMDFFIYALLFRPQGNGLPIGFEDESGKRQKLYIQQALKELSIDVSSETLALQKLGGNFTNWQRMSAMLVRLIEDNWPKLVQNSSRWFP